MNECNINCSPAAIETDATPAPNTLTSSVLTPAINECQKTVTNPAHSRNNPKRKFIYIKDAETSVAEECENVMARESIKRQKLHNIQTASHPRVTTAASTPPVVDASGSHGNSKLTVVSLPKLANIKRARSEIEIVNASSKKATTTPATIKAKQPTCTTVVAADKRVCLKPPLPPKLTKTVHSQLDNVHSPCIRKKIEQNNEVIISKLTAHAEQLRLEIFDLKSALSTEKTAVRALRAQNDAEMRRLKLETRRKNESALHCQQKSATTCSKATTTPKAKPAQTIDASTITDVSGNLSDLISKLSQKVKRVTKINKFLVRKNQMRKLKKSNTLNGDGMEVNRTSFENEYHSMPCEVRSKLLVDDHVDEDVFSRNKDTQISDNDSALSSAPPSLSSSCPSSPDVWQTYNTQDSKDIDNLQKDYEQLQDDNNFLKCELTSAHDELKQLQIILAKQETNRNSKQQYLERINYLEQSCAALLKNKHDLLEQNELLEFRIIELEESNDQVKSKTTNQQQQQNQQQQNNRMIATVQPYCADHNKNDMDTGISMHSTPKRNKLTNSQNMMQESGVFDGELSQCGDDIITYHTQTTQTDNETTADLCAEIQKLHKFREELEQQHALTKPKQKGGGCMLTTEKRHLQFYKDRNTALENKIAVYESSGELQLRRLSERLQRETQLEAVVHQLSDHVERLKLQNHRLDEEKCEFEEAENDTRLRFQRLEVDIEILTQRNLELEMSRDTSKSHAACIQETLNHCQKQLVLMQVKLNDSLEIIDMIGKVQPVILLYTVWLAAQEANNNNINNNCIDMMTLQMPANCIEASNKGYELQQRLHEMKIREKELTQNIAELNLAYNETLESADNLWAQMEKEYKDKLRTIEDNETMLKCKITQLESRIKYDSICAQERIAQLEESEGTLKQRCYRMKKENKELTVKCTAVLEELCVLKEEYDKLKCFLKGPAADCIEKERNKSKELGEEIKMISSELQQTIDAHRYKMNALKAQLKKSHKELVHSEVTNAELREEVFTLEHRLHEFMRQKSVDEEMIASLTGELKSKEETTIAVRQFTGTTLAQELNSSGANWSADSNNETFT